MKKIEAKYYNFLQRFLINSGLIYVFLIAVLLEIIIFADGRFNLESITLINSGFLIIILLYILKAYNETKHYLKEVIIDNEKISFILYRYDMELPSVVVPINKLEVQLKQDFIARYRRVKLEIRMKDSESNFNYKLLHKQYEIGFWKTGELKRIFQLIRETQGKLGNTANV